MGEMAGTAAAPGTEGSSILEMRLGSQGLGKVSLITAFLRWHSDSPNCGLSGGREALRGQWVGMGPGEATFLECQ